MSSLEATRDGVSDLPFAKSGPKLRRLFGGQLCMEVNDISLLHQPNIFLKNRHIRIRLSLFPTLATTMPPKRVAGTGLGRPQQQQGYAKYIMSEVTNPENRSVVTSVAFFAVSRIHLSDEMVPGLY